MASISKDSKYPGVGKPRERKGIFYYPICFRFHGQEVINTSVKADSPAEASRKLKERIAEFHSKPQGTINADTDFDVVRETLRKDVNTDIDAKKTRQRYMNIYNRVFVEFRQKYYPTQKGCSNLPVGFFKIYKSYFREDLKKTEGGLRAELILLKAIMNRLKELGDCTEEDLRQVRAIPTPESPPKMMPKYTDKQIHDLLEYIKKDRPDYYKPTKFMHLVGRRVAETCSITKDDVAMDGLKPLSIQTKPITAKKKKQIPPLIYLDDPELNALVRSALANNKTPWLFPYTKGGKVPPNYLWKYLSKTSLSTIGVKVTSHFFRKRFLTMANRGGINRDSMAMANIKNVSVMMKNYVETTPEGQAKVLEKIRGGAYNEKA